MLSLRKVDIEWPEHLRSNLKVQVSNSSYLAVVGIGWKLNSFFRGVRHIRISGTWRVSVQDSKSFSEVNYRKPNLIALKSSTPDTITKKSDNDAVNILKDSEAIIIKGADPGANIKVYSKSGVEIKSVISNNDVVNIKLPANQIYIVHIGKSRYKVAL